MPSNGNNSGRVILKCRFVCEHCGEHYDETFSVKESNRDPKASIMHQMYNRHRKCRVCQIRPQFKHINTDVLEYLPPSP